MQTTQQWFLDFMGQPDTQFTIPVYQRVYSWYENQCEELVADVMQCGKAQVSHFISMTLYLDTGTVDGVRKLDIIDGQQRIASVTIALTALRDYLRETGDTLKGTELANWQEEEEGEGETHNFDAEALHEHFLIVRGTGDPEAKVKLIGPDGATLSALVLGTEMPEHPSIRVRENYEYFSRRMHEEGFDAQIFWNGIRELLVIAAQLDEDDEAQTVFEGLNTKGIPLTAADLMRNYLLVGETRREQQRLYEEYWQPMEIMFEDDLNSSGSLKLNTGLRMWLAIRFRRMCISDRSRTYHYFKLYMETEYDGTFEEVLDEMRSFCYLWAANYECIGGRTHCSKFDWAKNGKRKTLVPPMCRAADVGTMVRNKSHEQILMESMEPGNGQAGAAASMSPLYHRGVVTGTSLDEATAEDIPERYREKRERIDVASYETTTFGQWGGEPIVWRVLKRDDDKVLLISERSLDSVPYHSFYNTITWAKSDLRKWANSTFVADAFSKDELSRLVLNKVHTDDDALWETVGGDDCDDLVYLLSVEEAQRYFISSDDRMAEPTDFARKNDIYVENGYTLWWLRSPGHGQGFASTIWPVGGVDTAGSGVGRAGVGFRPVISLRL